MSVSCHGKADRTDVLDDVVENIFFVSYYPGVGKNYFPNASVTKQSTTN